MQTSYNGLSLPEGGEAIQYADGIGSEVGAGYIDVGHAIGIPRK